VSAGFFWPQDPNPARLGDTRFIDPYPAIERSTLDLVDLHVYADAGLSIPQMFENFKLTGDETKPILMGELGAADLLFPTAAEAVVGLRRWIADSCDGGFGGWLLWTWDSTELPDHEHTWYARRENDAVGRGLSPSVVPDPCAGGRRRTSLEVSTSGTTVSGRLTDGRGTGLAGEPVHLELASADGPGEPATYALTGTVPAAARSVLVGLRANLECACSGDVDVRLYRASVRENGGPNLIGNPDFANGMDRWGAWGAGSVTIEPSDRDAGNLLHAVATPQQDIGLNSFDYAVVPGASYEAAFEARIPPSSAGSGHFLLVFLDASGAAVASCTIPFAAAAATFDARTSTGGRFSFEAGAATGARRGRVVYAGSPTSWEATATVSLPAPSPCAARIDLHAPRGGHQTTVTHPRPGKRPPVARVRCFEIQ
jgi:hypothetical protein